MVLLSRNCNEHVKDSGASSNLWKVKREYGHEMINQLVCKCFECN